MDPSLRWGDVSVDEETLICVVARTHRTVQLNLNKILVKH